MKKKIGCFFTLLLFAISCMAQTASITLTNTVTGIQGASLKNVQARLQAQQSPYQNKLTTENVGDLYKASFVEIKHALRPFGYFKPIVQGQLVHTGNNWQAYYQINQGPPLRITHLSIQLLGDATKDPAYRNYLVKSPLQQGQIFNAETYKTVKQKLFDLASQRGYFKAKLLKAEILINLQTYTCDITLIFNSGPRYRLGTVTFNKTPYSEKFLRRFIPFKTGQPYNEKWIQQLQSNLNSGTYFESVVVKPYPQEAQNLIVPVKVTLKPRKAVQYNLGIGYGTDTGPRALFGVNWRR